MIQLTHRDILVRTARKSDAKQLAQWWNDGEVMAHAGFPNGLGTTEEKVAAGLGEGLLIIEAGGVSIGECNYRIVDEKTAEIGIKICRRDYQERGIGKVVLSLLIRYLFDRGFGEIILDTNLQNHRAQHVYASLGFRKVGVNVDAWKDQLGQWQSSVDYALTEGDFVDFAGKGD